MPFLSLCGGMDDVRTNEIIAIRSATLIYTHFRQEAMVRIVA